MRHPCTCENRLYLEAAGEVYALRAQAERLKEALEHQRAEFSEENRQLQHELDIALDGNARLIQTILQHEIEVP